MFEIRQTLPQEGSSHIASSTQNQLGPQHESMTIDRPEVVLYFFPNNSLTLNMLSLGV